MIYINLNTQLPTHIQVQSTMSFFTFMSSIAQTNAKIESDTNMAQVEEGNNRALVVYNSGNAACKDDRSMYEAQPSSSKRSGIPNNDDSTIPFTPSKRQYREVDESISLREKNRALMATNETLLQQQAILTQRAEEASQLEGRQKKLRESREKFRSSRRAN